MATTAMTAAQNIICGSCTFYHNFDSANLAKVEQVKIVEAFDKEHRESDDKFSMNAGGAEDKPDYEFNVWTKHDCHGTEYHNNNRTWFYFGLKPNNPGVCIKFNVVNLNRQSKMFSQGMCPVFKTIPGHPHWERIRNKPTYSVDQRGSEFTLSFIYRTPENPKAISYLAFTYPFTYRDLQNYLNRIDGRMAKRILLHPDDIYYHRECAIKSLDGRRLEVLTVSSFHNITTEREDRLSGMFPESNDERSFKFRGKKVVFMSARVHPGETPSSFVFNGFLNFLLNRDDPTAVILRRIYVFKLIPMLNPDGVARGHYRMDTRGVNLNRVYLAPSFKYHPTIFAARSLIRYYHNHYEVVDESLSHETCDTPSVVEAECTIDRPPPAHASNLANITRDTTNKLLQQVTLMTLDDTNNRERRTIDEISDEKLTSKIFAASEKRTDNEDETCNDNPRENHRFDPISTNPVEESGLFLYIDMHGHASKKGVFMYGNYFDDTEDTIMCMLLPKLMSINNPNFHFASCSFAERNMYLVDKRDGMSREGSGRVAVYKLTGLIRSYTLECNYNSGRLVNTLPARLGDGNNKTPSHMFVPPKYTPTVFEEVGAALGPSILDLTNNNPNSRLPNSQYRSLRGVKSFLKLTCVNNHGAPMSNKSRNKDNGGSIIAIDAVNRHNRYNRRADNEETSMKYHATKYEDNSENSEMSGVTKIPRIVRRCTPLCTTLKRIKSGRKTRQSVNRKSLKNQRAINGEIDCGIAKIVKSSSSSSLNNGIDNASHVRSIGYEKSIDGNIRNSIIIEKLSPSSSSFSTSSSSASSSSSSLSSSSLLLSRLKKQGKTNGQTGVVKHGTKRLKIASPRIIKTRPEIGESSKNTTVMIATAAATIAKADEKSTVTLGILRLRNKQNAKNTFGRCRKASTKNDGKTKTRRSGKLKVKG